ncbi:MAG: hypothetical protein H6Q84_1770 [Deltaproteobacteria bacterium]|nr:hypothetical protein [Deltaproteobacteria bacterium]
MAGKVALAKTSRGVREALSEVLERVGGLGRYVRRGDRVLLKPNLNSVDGCTDKALVESLIRMLSDLGAGRVFLAEATFGGAEMTDIAFRETGYDELARKCGVPLYNLNRSEAVMVAVKKPLVLDRLPIAREVFEADRIINLPNMKVHYATGITLALKNLKGLLVGDGKRRCHEVGLDKSIVDLNNTIRPHLNIVDAIACMERMGPRGGDLFRLDLLMAGENPGEVDCVGCAVMGFEVGEVRHLKLFVDSNGIDPGGIETVGERVEEVRRPFRKAELANLVPEKLRVRDRNACSACMNAFLLACSRLEREPGEAADVYMGSIIEESEPSDAKKIAFGNCCLEAMEADIRIPGCPPYPHALKEILEPGDGE